MGRGTIVLGAFIAALSFGAGLAQTSVDGLDLEAIDKRVHESAGELTQFVGEVLDRQAKVDADQRASIEGIVDAATRKVAALKPSTTKAGAGTANPNGVDLDELVSDAGAAAKPEANAAPVFIAFASLSMPADSLARLIADVSKAGGMVVFRGFPPDGARGFMEALRKVVPQGEDADIRIDPRLFTAYHVEAVPAYVAASSSFALCSGEDCSNQPPPFDRLSGNVTTHFALKTFADGKGPGAPVATAALARLDSER